VITRGEGVRVFDDTGKGYIEAVAGLWCASLGFSNERLVEAAWGTSAQGAFPVDIVIDATDRTGLLRDITEILSREHVNVTATNSVSRASSARMMLTLEVPDLAHLERMLGLIRAVPGVARAARL
jgi:GTP pyrophosphokinase